MANELARTLRKTMTPQEVKLWARLRALRQRGFHFRRQVPLAGYITDFACLRERLIIEVDGGQHGRISHVRRDAVRDATLRRGGFRILRLWNSDVDQNLEGVLDRVLNELEGR